jgi:hypothetical protein
MEEPGPGEPVAPRSPLLHRVKRHELGHGQTPLGNQDLLPTFHSFQVPTQVGLQLGYARRLHMTIMDMYV